MGLVYPVAVCEAKSVGLVRYPTVLGGSVAQLKCADNAQSRDVLTAMCSSSGSWSDRSPQCVCDELYRVKRENGQEEKCEGYKDASFEITMCVCVCAFVCVQLYQVVQRRMRVWFNIQLHLLRSLALRQSLSTVLKMPTQLAQLWMSSVPMMVAGQTSSLCVNVMLDITKLLLITD